MYIQDTDNYDPQKQILYIKLHDYSCNYFSDL